ncbi:conjugal transfer mating pair stabilization protein TraG [Rahnella sp. L72c]|uniref:Conjugal transfer mating pair stabilization protein TraG n=1 Tax=Rahnella perminowiae TaxID=2816244 RepID=A0ABS6KVQ1_9GAMM|nr:conjugal transfer mating-pair stabilization protein TraG [Rahnella perminowiae]MBU9833690.1 conjugal transfer mating pair stabilization protein TraG [Rahnella perminowiae]
MDVIYTISGGAWFRDSLNAVAAFTQSDTGRSLMTIGTVLSVVTCAVAWIRTHDIFTLVKWALILTIIHVLINVTRPVQIIDATSPHEVYQVDNVPVGLVLPATVITTVGHGLVAGYEFFMHQPDALAYSQTGMLFGATLVGSSTDYESVSAEQTDLFADYVQNCVVGDMLLNKKYSMNDLMNSADPYTLIFSKPSPLRGMFNEAGKFMTCQESAATLQKMMNTDASVGGTTWTHYIRKYLGNKPERAALYSQLMGDSYQYFYGAGKSASEIMRHNVTLNALRHGFAGYAARNGDTASLVNLSAESSFAKMRMSQATSASIATRTLPIMQTVLTGVLIGLFPLLLVIAMISTLSFEVMKGYMFTFAYLQSWPVLFAILNNAMNSNLQEKTSGIAVTLSNLSERQQMFSDIGTTAGWLALSIPFLSFYLVKGLGNGVSQAGSYLGSAMQSSASQSSSQAVDGNWSFNNMQTDNVQGGKWDTNSSHASGQITNQTGTGALVTQTGDGGTVYNTTGAMSKLPTDVTGGKMIGSTAQRMERESVAQAQSHLSGYNHSVNSAFNQANQFSQQYGNSSTMSSSADNAQSMSDTIAANKMVSAAKSYAQKNNISFADAWNEMDTKTRQTQISGGARVSAGFDSNKQLAGKIAGLATGVSIKGDIHGGIEVSGATGSQDSMNKSGTSGKDFSADQNSQELRDYREGRDVLTSHRTSQSGSHSDNTANSKLEQLSASLAEADSQYQQYTDSMTHSREYSKIASESETMSTQTQNNYAQELVNYVQAQAPGRAEAILTNTADPNIRAEREQLAGQFVEERLRSQVEGHHEQSREHLSEGMPSVQNTVAPVAGNAYQRGEREITNRTNNAAVRTDSADRASAMIDDNNKTLSSERLEINTVKNGINNNRDNLKADHETAEKTFSAEHGKAQQAQDSLLPRFSEIREETKKHSTNLKDEDGDK